MSEFRNTDGTLNTYALMLGYRDSRMVDGSRDFYGTDANGVSLFADGSCFHVLVRVAGVTHDADGHALRVNGARVDWHTFDTLTEARQFWRRTFTAVKRDVYTLTP